jgi:hypothetical protein
MKDTLYDTIDNFGGDSFFSISIALYPLLSMYGFGMISIGDIVVLLAIFFPRRKDSDLWVVSRKPIRYQWLFLGYCVLNGLLSLILIENAATSQIIKRIVKQGFYIYIISQSRVLLNRKLFVDTYKKIVYLSFAGLMIQYFAYYVLGMAIVPKIPFLPFCGAVSEEGITSKLLWQFRPGSFYSEPAACSYVILPYLAYALFKREHNKHRKLDIVISTASVLMTVSSAGLICCVSIYIGYIINIFLSKEDSINIKIKRIISIVLLSVIAYFIFINTPLYLSFSRINRAENEILADAAWGKTSSGSELFEGLGEMQKVFGMGFGNINLGNLSYYTNGVYYLLYCTGYIGFAIMLLWFISELRTTRMCGKTIAVVFAELCVAARVVISSCMIYFNLFCMLDDKNLEEW